MAQTNKEKLVMLRIKSGTKGSSLRNSIDLLHDLNTDDRLKEMRVSTGFKNQNPAQINFIKFKGDPEKIKNIIPSSSRRATILRKGVDVEVKVVDK